MTKLLLTVLCSLLLFSCKKQFLELPPVSNANTQAFYKTEQDIDVAVNAAYATLQLDGQYRYAYWQFGEVRSDNTMNWDGAGNFPDAEIDQFKESSSNAIITAAWVDGFRGILLSNVVLDRIGDVAMAQAAKDSYTGQVKFLRALMYFNLVRVFGDLPLVTKETKSVEEGYAQKRLPVAEIYVQIVKDLLDAEQLLPASYSGANVGRATKGAAKGLLGKVYLTTKDYASAVTKLKEVIDLNTYKLLPNYADLWKVTNPNSVESLFEVQFKKGGTNTGSNYNNQFAPRNSGLAVTQVGFAHGRNIPNADLAKAYEAGDARKNASMAESYVSETGQTVAERYTVKFRDKPFVDGDADNHWPVLRYADVLLMYAEALNEKNAGPNTESLKYFNEVRARAGLAPLATITDKNSFALAIERERRVELAFEGHRWFDLLRTDRAITVMNAHFNNAITIKQYQLLFPVPQSQVNINPSGIPQNPGY
jgi:hypothetical protein